MFKVIKMKSKKDKDFIIRIPRRLYSKEMQKMFDFLRYKKATLSSKAKQKDIEELVEKVRTSRNEKKMAQQYL